MFITNMKVSSSPMSAWNFRSENDQVERPIDMVIAVKITATPVSERVMR